MKRLICVLLAVLLLLGCGREVITPASAVETTPGMSPTPASAPVEITPAPSPTQAPTAVPLPTCVPRRGQDAAFAEELLSHDGEPLLSRVKELLAGEKLTKKAFYSQFADLIRRVKELDEAFLHLQERGRALTADRREKTVEALTVLMSAETMDALLSVYARCPGEGEDLPISDYAAAMDDLIGHVQAAEERTVSFYDLDERGAGEYREDLSRYLGEPIAPQKILAALESLAQTEAYALSAALQADPEAGRKRERITFGSLEQDLHFLYTHTESLCPLPDEARLPELSKDATGQDRDLLHLAFYGYPGMAFLRAYSAHVPAEQRIRWANAPDGYLAGLAIHAAYTVVPQLGEFGLDYVQYLWYEEMVDVALTGICALLIHYYGYSARSIAAYLEGWGAASFAGYLYDRAMFDPFECLVAAYGYWCYLDICQAALDAGCTSEALFLRDYLAAGPAPYEALKEYMVRKYQKQG